MREISVLFEKQGEEFVVQSPAVGLVSELPLAGQILQARSYVGKLSILSSQNLLRLPESVYGKVLAYDAEEKVKAVGYGQILFTLSLVSSMQGQDGSSLEKDQEKESRKSGQIVVKSPTDGIFYRKPSPDAPYYADVGKVIHKGQVLALVEVMKCFNQIFFAGPDIPEQAKVSEICVPDSTEVKYQQPLFILEAVR